jgi:hypothetical protein
LPIISSVAQINIFSRGEKMKNETGSERVAAYSERKKGAGYKRICAYVSPDTDKLIQSYIDMGFNQGEAIDAIALDSVNNNPRFGLIKILDIREGFKNTESISAEVKINSKIYWLTVNHNGVCLHNLNIDFGKNQDIVNYYNNSTKAFLSDRDMLIRYLIEVFHQTYDDWPKRTLAEFKVMYHNI